MVSPIMAITSSPLRAVMFMLQVPSTPPTVTVLASLAKPRSTCNGSHGLASSFSAQQKLYLPGCPCVALSISPGNAPPMFCNINRSARPSVAFAHAPCPKQPAPLLTSSQRAIGPFTINQIAAGLVVACLPFKLKFAVATGPLGGGGPRRGLGEQPPTPALVLRLFQRSP